MYAQGEKLKQIECGTRNQMKVFRSNIRVGDFLRQKPSQRDTGPDGFDDLEWPGALQEAIHRAKQTGARKRQNVPWSTVFERVEKQHRSNGEQAKYRKRSHSTTIHGNQMPASPAENDEGLGIRNTNDLTANINALV